VRKVYTIALSSALFLSTSSLTASFAGFWGITNTDTKADATAPQPLPLATPAREIPPCMKPVGGMFPFSLTFSSVY